MSLDETEVHFRPMIEARLRHLIHHSKEFRCAVAFWGAGAEEMMARRAGKPTRIVCNLAMGGTNPGVIRALMKQPGVQVRQHDRLHAKVYIGDRVAIVTSANFSANGLGLEGGEQAGWCEAGVELPLQSPIPGWFETIWEQGRGIEEADLERAKKTWRGRRLHRPSLPTFADFVPGETDFPLISWYDKEKWQINPAAVAGTPQEVRAKLEARLAGAVPIEGPEDRLALSDGRWLLFWLAGRGGKPPAKPALEWRNLGEALPKCIRYPGHRTYDDAVLPAERVPPIPFELDDRFTTAFRTVLSREEYAGLQVGDYTGAWFTPARLDLMRKAWADLRTEYEKAG